MPKTARTEHGGVASTACKKQKTSPAIKKKKQSHYQKLQDRIEEVRATYKGKGGAWLLPIRDVDDDIHGDEGYKYDKKGKLVLDALPKSVIDKYRGVFVPSDLGDMVNIYDKKVYDLQGDSYDTSFSWSLVPFFKQFEKKYNKETDIIERYHLLFSITMALSRFDGWMQDHESPWDGTAFINKLGHWWKVILENSDEDLGIDHEFTRPGLNAMLQKFKDGAGEDSDDSECIQFNFN